MQQFELPLTTDENAGAAVFTKLPAAARSLLTLHSGNSAPTYTEAYMLWAQPSTGTLWMRNAANDDWLRFGILGNSARQTVAVPFGAVSTTTTRRILAPIGGFHVERAVILTDTASTSSSGNEWQFGLRNETQAVDLFSGTVGTFSALGGVGGGAELAADVAYPLLADQNADIVANDVLSFTLTAVGTATSLADVTVLLEGWPTS